MEQKLILVIEDDAGMQNTYDLLFGGQYRLYQVASGQLAALHLRQRSFDLIIIDGRLTDGRGWEVLARLRREIPTLPPVIVVTGDAGAEELVAWQTAGVDPQMVLEKNGGLYPKLRALLDRIPGFRPPA
jgi:CheY-like chemotaxis protein